MLLAFRLISLRHSGNFHRPSRSSSFFPGTSFSTSPCCFVENPLVQSKTPAGQPIARANKYPEAIAELDEKQTVNGENSLLVWTEEELRLKEKAITENSWLPVYRFRPILVFWLLFRLNLVFCAFSLASVPYSIWQQLPIAPSLGLVLLSGIVSFLFKNYLSRLVGIISMDRASRSVFRIGHLSFTGERVNRFVRVQDIVPLSQSIGSHRLVSRLSFMGRPKSDFLLLFTHGVEILDDRAAFLIFGSPLKDFGRVEVREEPELWEEPAGRIEGKKEEAKKITDGRGREGKRSKNI